VVGPRRSRIVANLALGALGGLALIGIGLGFDALFSAPTSPDADSQGHVMLALTVAVVGATGLLRFLCDPPVQRFAVGRRVGGAAVAVVALAIVAGVVASNPAERWDEFKAAPRASDLANGQLNILRGTGSGRYQFWGTALDAFESAPVGGVGADGYSAYWFQHRSEQIDATRAHSLLFESLAELGLIGFALICGFLAIPAVVGVHRWRAAVRAGPEAAAAPGPRELGPALGLLAIGIVASAVDWTFDVPAVFAPTVLAAALLTGNATRATGAADRSPTKLGTVRSRRRFAGGVAVLLGAWVAICASGLLLLADHALTSSQHAVERGDLAEAIDDANSAIDLEPWAAEPRTQLALVYELAGKIPAARAALAEALDRAPRDYQLYLLALRLDREAGDLPAAAASYARARELNPLDPRVTQAIEQSGTSGGQAQNAG
jgi:tetratricopeptide (TPR) repeat protein